MLEQIKKQIISGDKVSQSGYYVYVKHVDSGIPPTCFVAEKAKSGLYLAKGSITPRLGSCPHDVEWQLVG